MNSSKKQTLKERLEGFQIVEDPNILNKLKSAIGSGLKYIKECESRREAELKQLAQDPRYHKPINAYSHS